MKLRNTTANRVSMDIFSAAGKNTDYVEPYGLSFDYSVQTVQDSRDVQIFMRAGILIEEGKEKKGEEEYRALVGKKVVLESVGTGEQVPSGGSVDVFAEGTVISRAPDQPFAKEKTISQMVKDTEESISDAISVFSNKEELLAKQKEKIQDAIKSGLATDTIGASSVPNRVSEFNSLKYFAKKTMISKCTDKTLLGEILAYTANDTVKALARQRIKEIGM